MLYVFLTAGVWYFTLLLYPMSCIEGIVVFLGKMGRRSHFPLRCLLALAAIFLLMFLLPTFPDIIAYHIIYFIIINVFIIFCAGFVFDVTPFSLLACCSAGICVRYVVSSIVNLFFLWSEGTGELWVQLLKSSINLIICVALFFLIPKNFVRRNVAYVNDKEVCIMLSVSVLFVIVFDQLSRFLGDGAAQKAVINLYSIFGASLILIFQLFMLNRRKVLSDYNRLNFMREMDQKRFELSSNIAEIANIKWHDFKHLMTLFGERTDGADINAGLGEFCESTGSYALDAILIANVISCRKADIKLTWFCERGALAGIDEMDVYSLFCNLLDNAIEAAGGMEKDKRVVSLVCSREAAGFVRIRVSNYYNGSVEFENGLPLTTKGDSDVHGYGLKSVKMIAEKYGGKLAIDTGNGMFQTQLLLHVSSAQS